jgi:CBS domain-containing protein
MTVGKFCNREVVTTDGASSVTEVARLMRDHHVGSVVVVKGEVENPEPLGIITDRDIVVEVLAEDVDTEKVTVGDVMSFNLVTAREEDGIWETIQRMRSRGIRRLPVVDHHGRLVGVLTMDDLLELFADEFSDMVQVISREARWEQATRSNP